MLYHKYEVHEVFLVGKAKIDNLYRKSFAEYWDQVKTNVIDVIMGMPGIVEGTVDNFCLNWFF